MCSDTEICIWYNNSSLTLCLQKKERPEVTHVHSTCNGYLLSINYYSLYTTKLLMMLKDETKPKRL